MHSKLSHYIDYKLKPLITTKIPTYLPDSDSRMESIKQTFPLGVRKTDVFFPLDTIGMYTNINVTQSVEFIKQWLTEEAPTIITGPINVILKSLELLMTHNIFYLGDLLIQQLNGTSIGTKCAVVLANLYAGLPERN